MSPRNAQSSDLLLDRYEIEELLGEGGFGKRREVLGGRIQATWTRPGRDGVGDGEAS